MSKRSGSDSVFLLVEIGNTNTDFALATRQKIQRVITVPTDQLNEIPFSQKQFSGVVLCSVVPNAAKMLIKSLPLKPLMISSGIDLGLRLRYPNPNQLGADRLANVVAAVNLYRTPAIVIDFGTAVTFDVINTRKEFVGGVIAPGIAAMKQYLLQKTAQLPEFTLTSPKSIIGKTTVEAMRAGFVIGYIGLVKEILETIRKQPGKSKSLVIATGSYGKEIAQHISSIRIVNPLLTLEGMRFIYLRNLK